MLMMQAHTNHEYIFKEMATKYCKKFTHETSMIKTQKSSILNDLGEISAAESSVTDQAQKCQDDVEHVFEEIISVLQTCKQAMKDEATAYYSSLTGVYQLKAIQSEIKSVSALVDTTSRGNDPRFLMKMESTFERISNLQKKFQAVSLTVDKPWQKVLTLMNCNNI